MSCLVRAPVHSSIIALSALRFSQRDAGSLKRTSSVSSGRPIAPAKARALELEAVGERAAVMNLHPMGFVPAALALVAPTRVGDLRDKLFAGIGEIDQLRLDRLGSGVELGDIGHGDLRGRFSDDRRAPAPRQPPDA